MAFLDDVKQREGVLGLFIFGVTLYGMITIVAFVGVLIEELSKPRQSRDLACFWRDACLIPFSFVVYLIFAILWPLWLILALIGWVLQKLCTAELCCCMPNPFQHLSENEADDDVELATRDKSCTMETN